MREIVSSTHEGAGHASPVIINAANACVKDFNSQGIANGCLEMAPLKEFYSQNAANLLTEYSDAIAEADHAHLKDFNLK
eukprot:5846806-Karenia_brevis.AAC.1